MGTVCSAPTKDQQEAARKDKEIMQWLRQDQQKQEEIIKLLLLGTGESGKSTIAKQLKILYIKGFTEEDRKAFKSIIHENVINAIKTLVDGASTLGLEVANKEGAERIKNLPDNAASLTAETAEIIKGLWQDPGIQEAYAQRSKLQLFDSANFYLDSVDRLMAPDYSPNDNDIVRARVRTTGVIEIDFEISQNKFKLVDVGGQRNERRKWLHAFEGVTAVMFVVAISEYDQVLMEDATTNRMHESVRLFQQICNSKWFQETNIILFLNKKDLFAEKIKKTDLTIAYPSYTGGKSYDKATKYIQNLFLEKNENPNKQIYVHFTCATDTENVKVVFNAAKDTILRQGLENAGVFSSGPGSVL